MAGIKVVEERFLVGSKKAILIGKKKLIVSPAVLSLMKGATSKELEHLVRNLDILQMPEHILPEIGMATVPPAYTNWRYM